MFTTGFARDQSWAMRHIMVPMMKYIGPLMGMAGPVSAAGMRYLEVAHYGNQESGKLFGSPPKKLVGKLEEQRTALLQADTKRNEAYKLIVELTDGMDYRNN